MQRCVIFAKKEPQAVFAKIGNGIFSGVLVAALYNGIGGHYDLTGVTNIAGCNFFIIVGLLMGWLFGSLTCF